MERRVQRSFLHAEQLGRRSLDMRGDGIAVHAPL